eukprot:119065-Lingulodinium_polyedra.AAC.1
MQTHACRCGLLMRDGPAGVVVGEPPFHYNPARQGPIGNGPSPTRARVCSPVAVPPPPEARERAQ